MTEPKSMNIQKKRKKLIKTKVGTFKRLITNKILANHKKDINKNLPIS